MRDLDLGQGIIVAEELLRATTSRSGETAGVSAVRSSLHSSASAWGALRHSLGKLR